MAELDAEDAAEDAAENARDDEQEEVAMNFNPNHGDNGQFTSGGKGGRESNGDRRGKKNHPKEIQDSDSLGEKERKLAHDIDEMRKGKNVATGYDMGKRKELHLMPGDKAHWGGVHGDRNEAHPKHIPSKDLAQVITRGKRGKNVTRDENGRPKKDETTEMRKILSR